MDDTFARAGSRKGTGLYHNTISFGLRNRPASEAALSAVAPPSSAGWAQKKQIFVGQLWEYDIS